MAPDGPPTSDAMVALHRLLEAVGDGTVDDLCAAHGVDLMGVFGSAYRRFRDAAQPTPGDLDVCVSFIGKDRPVLELLDRLMTLTGYDRIDLAVLNGANPVLRADALIGLGLYERTRGGWATAQMAALAEWRDTRRFRRLDMEILAG